MLSGSFAAMARCQAAGAKLLGSFATARCSPELKLVGSLWLFSIAMKKIAQLD